MGNVGSAGSVAFGCPGQTGKSFIILRLTGYYLYS